MNDCFKRIILDITDLRKGPIDGVHYFPNEDNIMEGRALIFGPEGTPYERGNYIFSFEFPKQYPYEPPKLTYETNDGMTRFNPNFYRSGKVCLSLLNTWEGDQWSACQSIRSILVTLQMTFNENPLLNEPGINWNSHGTIIHKYNQIIQYKNMEVSILNYLNKKLQVTPEIYELIKEHFIESRPELVALLDELHASNEQAFRMEIGVYNQNQHVDYAKLKNKLMKIKLN